MTGTLKLFALGMLAGLTVQASAQIPVAQPAKSNSTVAADAPLGPPLDKNKAGAGETWWSLQPLKRVNPPRVRSAIEQAWVQTPIDQFILAKLAEKKIRPSPPADKRTLLRRVYFDLIG